MNELEPSTANNRPPTVSSGRLVFGLALVALGLLFLLERFDLVSISLPWAWWPLILVALGVGKMLDSREGCEPQGGVWLVFVGLWLICNFQGYFGLTWENSWPLFLVMGGAMIVWRAMRGEHRRPHRGRSRGPTS